MNITKLLLGLILLFWSCEKASIERNDKINIGGFSSFSTNGQTLEAVIRSSKQSVRFEIDHDVDINSLIPEFIVPEGVSVEINGKPQISGISMVDFSQPVLYHLKDMNNHSIEWEATAIKLSRKILIDASHDGGVWWFPQSPQTGFDATQPHQGKMFADLLRGKGFEVDEIGRGQELTEEMFFGYYIVIRAGGFEPYSPEELKVYTSLIGRGMNLVFFTDHKKYDIRDELGDHLGLNFQGIAYGYVSRFSPHMITQNMDSLLYLAGSVLINADGNPDIQILGWLGEDDYADLNFNGIRNDGEPLAPPVMGILNYPKSRVFFIGDTNGFQIWPQPFIDNLINWMGIYFKD